MPNRRGVTGHPIERVVYPFVEYTEHFAGSGVGTCVIGSLPAKYTAIASFGTINTTILSAKIDPGIDLNLKTIQLELTQKFTNLDAASTGSLEYYWQVRPTRLGEGTTGNWVSLGDYATEVPTKGETGDAPEDTFSGYIPIASLSETPFELELHALCYLDGQFNGEVRDTSFVKLTGLIIPGT